jgi:Domain of Unknown Function with PDB structure (DUF3857)/Transglutaminase-like superfamily
MAWQNKAGNYKIVKKPGYLLITGSLFYFYTIIQFTAFCIKILSYSIIPNLIPPVMKKITLIFSSLLLFLATTAQDKIPKYGTIDKADLEMKDCDFDPGAEAVELLDVGEIQYAYIQSEGWQSEANYRIRIKILKASAIHRAEIKIKYYSKSRFQEVSNINGISYNLDAAGNVVETKMEKKAVFNKTIDKEYSEFSFALPDVKLGSVFEYKYRITRKSYSYIPAWTFQKSIPVKYSAYNLTIPEYFQFTVQSTVRQKMDRKDDKYNGTWYTMHNVPGLKEEPYSSGRDGYLQRVEFQLSKIVTPSYYEEVLTTWPKIIKQLEEDEDFGGALKRNIKGTSDLDMQLKTAKSTKDKVQLVYNYVQKNMQWNDEYGIYSNNGIKDAWDKKNGNIADINFILINLLRDAGVDAKPLIASTKDNGTINTFFPFLRQFNCVLAYVADGNTRYIMNAADKYNPFNLVPYDVLYTNGLVVDKNDGGVVGLNSDKKFSNSIYFSTGVEADGKISGQAMLSSSGYARNIRLSTYKKDKLKAMIEDNEGITIKADSITVNNEADELKPLEQAVKFSGNMQTSGDYLFLPCTLFTGIGKNPFIEENRVMDIDFDYPKNYVVTGSFNLGDNYVVNELPKNTKMIMPDTSIVLMRIIQQDDNIISFRFTLDFKSPGYNAEGYPYIKEFFKKMYEILDERIVLKKK